MVMKKQQVCEMSSFTKKEIKLTYIISKKTLWVLFLYTKHIIQSNDTFQAHFVFCNR